MAKALDFKEYTAKYEDRDGDEHESTIRAAVVGADDVHVYDDEDNRKVREVVTPTGSRKVQEGDVFVETETPGVYDYLSAEAWKGSGYGGGSDNANADDSDSEGKSEDKASDSGSKTPAKKAASSSGQR